MNTLPSIKRPCTPPRDTPAGAVGVFERNGERLEMLWSARARVWCLAKNDNETPRELALRIDRLWGYGFGWPAPWLLKRAGWRLVEVHT